jgi:lysophospholipase L1-like esterase
MAMLLLPGQVQAVPGSGDEGYLALGDSVAFGYSPLLDKSNNDNFVGYPEALAPLLGLGTVANPSCPGEASGGFISLTGVDNSCRPYRASYPLHRDYATAQLDYAVAYLLANPRTRLVSLNIGANDLFVLQKACNFVVACIINGLPQLLIDLTANLNTIYTAIRGTGYQGKLAGLTYYSTNYADATGVAVISAINQVVAGRTIAFGGVAANGFAAFQAVAAGFAGNTCAAGLLIVTGATCDIHPSPAGRDLLAAAIKAVV